MSSIKNCMLCGSVANISEVAIDRYIAEEKFDGERIVAIKNGDNINLVNRRGASKENIYIEITESLKKFDFDFVIDGEIVAEKGVFNDLQRRALLRDVEEIKKRAVEIPTKFMAFDIISLKGEDLKSKPLLDRKKILSDNIKDNDRVVACEWISGEDNIKDLWEKIREENKEGIILKIKNSIYQNKRTNAWVKLKNFKEIELSFNGYEMNNAGVKVNDGFNEVQIQGLPRAEWVINSIKSNGFVKVIVQYLDKEKTGKLRFPSCKEVVGYE
jgi:ATP-dependent DNA ligase